MEVTTISTPGVEGLSAPAALPEKPALHGCTIVARNYLAQAEVLARSFRQHHPDSPFTILLVDELANRTPRHGGAEFLTLAEIGLAPGDEFRMPMIYDVTELSTAVKPWLLRKLHERGSPVVIYLDPDIEIFSPLHELAELARQHSIVLTPHVTEPIPRDNLRLSESDILGAGIYNLGFIAVGPGSDEFLTWWAARLRRESVIDPARMRFTDQRWIDFVPGLFRHYIVRDPGFNVAYWNLHSRKVAKNGAGYTVNGRPLRFFHYSGYDPESPHILSKHQGANPRINLSERAGVRELCDAYAQKLAAAGFRESKRHPYGFESLANGLRIDQRLRRIYREALERSERNGEAEPPSPFGPENEEEFLHWLNEPMTKAGAGVTRFMIAIHEEREDLQRAFPSPLAADALRFYTWFSQDAQVRELIHPALIPQELPPPPEESTPAPVTTRQSEGPLLNVAGYFRAELGIGEAARLLLRGLEAAGLPYQTVSCAETVSRQDHPFATRDGGGATSDINIVCVNADQTPIFAQTMGPEFYQGRYTIGVWFWEVEEFPSAFRPAFDHVDEVWVATEFMREVLAKVSPKPVHKFHLPLVRPNSPAALPAGPTGTDGRFTFLFSFDFMSILERKNPFGAIEAFKRAFAPNEGPVLLIKTINGNRTASDLERVRLAAADRPDIIVSDGYLSAAEKDALMARCDCYVSLHRSEGFGLTMAEAMSLGKPVIATGYSGNLEFMTPENSYLCSFEYTEVGPGSAPYPPDCRWAQPNLDEASAFMRQVYRQQEEARARGSRAATEIATRHSPAVAGRAISERIAAIRAQLAAAETQEASPKISETPPPPRRRPLLYRWVRSFLRHFFKEERDRIIRLEHQQESLRAAAGATATQQEASGRRETAALREMIEAQKEMVQSLATRLELLETITPTVAQIPALREALAQEAEQTRTLAHAQQHLQEGVEKRLDAVEAVASATHESAARQDHLLGILNDEVRNGATRLDEITTHFDAVPFMADPSILRTETSDGKEAIGYRRSDAEAAGDDLYLSFESIFRGSEEMIRERQRTYLDVLRDRRGPVVDLGCGRGEMLDLLREASITAVGVDTDAGMVKRARAKGNEVVHESALPFLRAQPDGSIGGIFCAQVIEHMPYKELLELLLLGRQKLEPGGPLVLETVNPHSHRALKTFWVDLTHNQPIFPEVLVALCRETGYGEAIVRFPCGRGDLQHDRAWEGEYAVIARNLPSSLPSAADS